MTRDRERRTETRRLPNGTSLALTIRTLRRMHDWTQYQLDDRAGLARGHTALIEGGYRNPNVTTLCKLAVAFGVDTAYLTEFTRTGEIT